MTGAITSSKSACRRGLDTSSVRVEHAAAADCGADSQSSLTLTAFFMQVRRLPGVM
jgi:hypothetical protein